jgi:hypothetical protein
MSDAVNGEAAHGEAPVFSVGVRRVWHHRPPGPDTGSFGPISEGARSAMDEGTDQTLLKTL